ncbi:MAG: UDP-N-acetylmuramate--L-alanine ligase [Thermanaerothrix sp.]|nr:UDP-N-acetylmuramate--L-alanine ligase [Thermanaerothrix sp.]
MPSVGLERGMKIHLMGIGGAGMSGLALLLKGMGCHVSGCDAAKTSYSKKLVQGGVEVLMGHDEAHVGRFLPDLLVYTSAIEDSHPEIVEARRAGVAVAKRAEVLSAIFNSKRGVGVAGTHGKTTTSSMLALIAELHGISPTVAIGGELCDIGCNAKLGSGDVMVAELDESDGSFELFEPEVAVVTNVDWDHVDHYGSVDDVLDAFLRFIGGVKNGGTLVICADDGGTHELLRRIEFGNKDVKVLKYGWGTAWDWGATNVCHIGGGGVAADVYKNGEFVGELRLRVSGEHNVLNALGACAAAEAVGVPFGASARILSSFSGAKRRFQRVGSSGGVDVFDDYGHHPREIQATINAARGAFPGRRLVVVFQPHRYTRTSAMYADFAKVLALADKALVLPIYPADEKPISGVSSSLIVDSFPDGASSPVLCESFDAAVSMLSDFCRQGDVVLTVGAGNVSCLGERIVNALGEAKRLDDKVAVGSR